MTERLERDDVIRLLDRLGGERDEDVLEAARQVHARITAANLSWEDLLVSEDDAGEPDDTGHLDPDDEDAETPAEEGEGNAETPAEEGEDAETPAEEGEGNAESLALIDKMLAMPGNSEDFIKELNGYKTDIAEGEFEERDRQYIGALYKRLTKRR